MTINLLNYEYWTEKQKYFYVYQNDYGETILAKIRKLEKTMIKYSSCTNHLRLSFHCHHNLKPNDGRSISWKVAHLNILVTKV